MKIGLLEAEQLTPEILKKYGSYADMTMRLLHSVDDKIAFQTYQITRGEYPADTNDCDAYLITGSKASAYDDDAWIVQLADYVKDLAAQQKKLIGICFGHQLIAQALGGQVEKSTKGWGVGIMSSKLLQTKAWMQPMQDNYSLLVSHQDQVTVLPDNAVHIAENAFCKHSSYQLGDHILSLQGHPEFAVEYAQQSMRKRREIVGEQCYQRGQASLQEPLDHKMIAQWIINFITG